jgi:hypothetical protein
MNSPRRPSQGRTSQAANERWLEIPWLLDIHEARQKPILVLSGGGATGIGAC